MKNKILVDQLGIEETLRNLIDAHAGAPAASFNAAFKAGLETAAIIVSLAEIEAVRDPDTDYLYCWSKDAHKIKRLIYSEGNLK